MRRLTISLIISSVATPSRLYEVLHQHAFLAQLHSSNGDMNSIIPRVFVSESKPQHFESMKNRVWLLGDAIVYELYEYKNLGVLKNYVGSFSSNVEDNIDKTRKKVGLIFASNFDRREVNPLVYVKLWKQVCLPSLFGAELWTLTPTLLLKLERHQY